MTGELLVLLTIWTQVFCCNFSVIYCHSGQRIAPFVPMRITGWLRHLPKALKDLVEIIFLAAPSRAQVHVSVDYFVIHSPGLSA